MFSDICHSVARQLITHGHSVSVAESSTGGLIAANLLSVAGASNYFRGGSVIYTRESRYAFLDLDLAKLKGLKPLTEPMVAEFADAARLKLDATWGIAELGAAGPKGTPYGHAPGTSVIGISGPVNDYSHSSRRLRIAAKTIWRGLQKPHCHSSTRHYGNSIRLEAQPKSSWARPLHSRKWYSFCSSLSSVRMS
jgi:PncC family amidohydrolase